MKISLLTMYAHFDFYKKMFGTTLSFVMWHLASKGYELECYPEHCENYLPFVLASISPTQKLKVHFESNVVSMIEVRETGEGGYMMYRKLYPPGK